MSLLRDFRSASAKNDAPITTGIIIAMIAGFVACWMDTSGRFAIALVFHTETAWQKPWTLLSYPFCDFGLFSLLFASLWIWSVGATLEREEGGRRYLQFWIAMSVLCGLGLWVGSAITKNQAWLASAWTPVAALTIVWGTRNPTACVKLMCVLPISGKWLAWLSAAIVFFGAHPPQMAPFAAAPLVLAWLYGARRLPVLHEVGRKKPEFVRGAGFYSKEYFDEVKRREKDREEKERLRKLFEGSVHEGDTRQD